MIVSVQKCTPANVFDIPTPAVALELNNNINTRSCFVLGFTQAELLRPATRQHSNSAECALGIARVYRGNCPAMPGVHGVH